MFKGDSLFSVPWLVCVSLLVGACGSGGGEKYEAMIVRTEYGIPHITAADYGSLGFGDGYAYAQDNYCVLMKEVVRSNGESARWFGEEEGSLAQDFVWRFFNTDEYINDVFLPAGNADFQAVIPGYAAGMNKYLEETGVDNLAEGDEGCRGEDWVRPITATDMGKVFRKLIAQASTSALAPLITLADPPSQSMARGFESPDLSQDPLAIDALDLPEAEELGSNMYAIGSAASQTGYGIVLGNPHFPWSGPLRWYVHHLTIPGELDVMGAALQGLPVVNIGFTKDVAWSHTVSIGQRFTFYELQLVEGDPMKYEYDDEVREIEGFPVTAEVLLEDGTIEERTEMIYMSHYGPIVNLAPLSELAGGWPNPSGTLMTYRDANIDNPRGQNLWGNINKAETAEDVLEALEDIGNPWVNTVAADRAGTALYADYSTVPHVTAQQVQACSWRIISLAINQLGQTSLDGADSACEWGSDPGTAEGVFGPDNLPSLITDQYVENSNLSYWLTNPDMLLTGFSPLLGPVEVEQQLRTRQGFVQAEDRLAAADGLDDNPGFTVDLVREIMFGNRNLGGELARDAVVDVCNATVSWDAYTANPGLFPDACLILRDWDGLFNIDSVGPALWTEFWDRFNDSAIAWTIPFDAEDPVNTPRGLNDADSAVFEPAREALGGAVDRLVEAGIPLDRPWGEVQFREVGDERIPIHGGEQMFMFSIASSRLVDGVGRIPRSGNSYIQAVTFDETECPDAYAILTYSQSTDPASDHFSDMTELYSEEGWVDLPFCPDDIADQQIGDAIEITN